MNQLSGDHNAVEVLTASHAESLGDFRIIREIGRGGMGIVYEAEQESLGRRVALKVISDPSLASPNVLRRFQREAQAAARLHHTNIVPVFGVGQQDGKHYYVMQYIEGRGLDKVLSNLSARRDRPSESPAGSDKPQHGLTGPYAAPASGNGYWREVARIGVQAADALDYAHRHDTLHRDVKPGNLLLDAQGVVWIADFGLAKLAGRTDLTGPHRVVGTVRYMAPEMFEGQSDARSDVYGLGLTLYELLTLQPAFDETAEHRLLVQVTEEEPPRPRTCNPKIPRDLEMIVLKAIARDPARRYQAADQLADDLRLFLEDRPVAARRTTAAERLWRWSRRNPSLAALSSATFLLLIAVAVLFAVGNYRTSRVLKRLHERPAEILSHPDSVPDNQQK